MSHPEPLLLLALVVWGAAASLDLVSFPQVLLSRPLVTAAGAGLLLGEVESGLRVGVLLELFALDVLPVGASRYPDYGPGVVGAVLLTIGGPWHERLGVAVLFALLMAVCGGWSLQWLRRLNGRLIQRYAAGLAAGDATAIAQVQWRGLSGDLLRGLLLSALSVTLALLLAPAIPARPRMALVTVVALGAGLAAAAGGAIRGAGRGDRLRWLAVGTGIGLLVAAFR